MSTAQTLLAKALYDNLAESPDELAFRRGDIITVLEIDTDGLEGWYLCSLRNKQGIAPGNRLKLISGMHGNDPGKLAHRRSLENTPSKLVMPQRTGDVQAKNKTPHNLDYDVPPTRSFHGEQYASQTLPKSTKIFSFRAQNADYDRPAKNITHINDAVRTNNTQFHQRDHQIDYDTPRKSNDRSSASPNGTSYKQLSCHGTPRLTLNVSQRTNDQVDYDTPSPGAKVRACASGGDDNLDYDTPTLKGVARNLYDAKRDSNSPDRCSFLSTDSAATVSSTHSDLQSQITSGIGSCRSSFDITAQDYYDVPPPRVVVSRDSGLDQDYDEPKHGSSEDYDVPRLDDSAYESPKITQQMKADKNLTHPPMRTKLDSQDYDSPRSRFSNSNIEDYDSPKSSHPSFDEEYDVPRTPKWYQTDIGDQDTLKANNKHGSVYDVPPQVTRDSVLSNKSDSSDGIDESRLSTSSLDSTFDASCFSYPDLPLTLDSAMDLLVKLQQDVKKSTLNLLSRVSSTWRKRDVMEKRLYDVKESCVNLVATLKAFVEFARGSLANSTNVTDKKLTKKLYTQLQTLHDTFEKINNSVVNLDLVNWNLMYLVEQKDQQKADDLGIVIRMTKGVMNDVRKIASTIHGNSSLLFRKSYDDKHIPASGKPSVAPKPRMTPEAMQQRPLPNVPDQSESKDDDTLKKSSKKLLNQDISRIAEDYDYVQLSMKHPTAKDENDDSLSYDEIVSDTVAKTSTSQLERNDQQLLAFYNKQIEMQTDELTKSIDAFFICVEKNSAPREFVAYGKLVILAAHKLVFTGDTMHRNLMHKHVRETVISHANRLCDLLKELVSSTKVAALQYPSVPLMQDMVDRTVRVTQSAKDLAAFVRTVSPTCAT